MNDEKRLLDSLMTGYDRNVRPVRNASNPIVIQLGITLTQIFDMVSEDNKEGRQLRNAQTSLPYPCL